MEIVLVHRAPSPRGRLAVDYDGSVVRTGCQQHAKLRVGPGDLPHRTIVSCEGLDLVVVVLSDYFEDLHRSIARCRGELLAVVVELRVMNAILVLCFYRDQRRGRHVAIVVSLAVFAGCLPSSCVLVASLLDLSFYQKQ